MNKQGVGGHCIDNYDQCGKLREQMLGPFSASSQVPVLVEKPFITTDTDILSLQNGRAQDTYGEYWGGGGGGGGF
jgi:hypothetical protein